MQIRISHKETEYIANLAEGLDISIPLRDGMQNPNCFYAPPVEFFPVRAGDFVGDTAEGGLVNFKNIRLNPHGNGTHTECVGHIAKEWYSINACLRQFHHIAQVVSVFPQRMENGDRVILREQLPKIEAGVQAIIIRTMPNDALKMSTTYSGANPPYMDAAAMQWLVEQGIEHLLIDLPSVDREEDEGKLLAHHAFWQYPEATREHCTITELIYVPQHIKDGIYLLNLQIASFELDVSPSKPLLYKLTPILHSS